MSSFFTGQLYAFENCASHLLVPRLFLGQIHSVTFNMEKTGKMHNTDLSAFLVYEQNDKTTFTFSMRQKVFPNDPKDIIYKDYPAG